jgi:glycosyltransferase involved in cell wall biosynthesis
MVNNKRSRNNGRVIIATSIAPKNVERQQAAIQTWLDLGFSVVSLNIAEEIEQLQLIYKNISFHTVTRHGKKKYRKPYVYIDDILSYLQHQSTKICGIINSDIYLKADKNFLDFVTEQATNALLISSRLEVSSASQKDGRLYNFGFDMFFFDRSILAKLPTSEFCLGVPWWDYWMPLVSMQNGLVVKYLANSVAYHLEHDVNYNNDIWCKTGMEFTKLFAPHLHSLFTKALKRNSNWNLVEALKQVCSRFILMLEEKTQRIVYHQETDRDPGTNRNKSVSLMPIGNSSSSKAIILDENKMLLSQLLNREIEEGISVFTCCMNRNENLRNSLSTWVKIPEIDEIVIVDWSSDESLKPLVDGYCDSRIVLARVNNQKFWVLSYAFNLAARLTTRSKILKLDADTKIKPGFFQAHNLEAGNFFTGNWRTAKNDSEKRLNGIIYCHREDFFHANGYNEYITTYGWDDCDLYSRLESIGLQKQNFLTEYLEHQEHQNRTKNQKPFLSRYLISANAYGEFETRKNDFICQKLPQWARKNKMLEFDVSTADDGYLTCEAYESIHKVPTNILNAAETNALRTLLSWGLNSCGVELPACITQDISKQDLTELYAFVNSYEAQEVKASVGWQIITELDDKMVESYCYYKCLVWSAWRFYQAGNFERMTSCLKKSLSCAPYLVTETFFNWISLFKTFAADQNTQLDTHFLSSLPEWQNLVQTSLIEKTFHVSYSKPRVSIITSVFKGDEYIEEFLRNITRQTVFNESELILINPNSPGNEEAVIKMYMARHQNIIYKKLAYDPGLYEVWNMAIQKIACGEYITNANLDDRRSPEHLEKHIEALDANPDVDLVSAPLKVTNIPNETWENNSAFDTWFVGFPTYFSAKDLFQKKWWDQENGKDEITSQNLAHCMPLWRKSVHDKNGYFNEAEYGASADWEFWLRCARNGSKFMLLKEPLGLYLQDTNSYGRRFEETKKLEKKIIEKYYKPLIQV